jgi:hypothetical protein
MRFPRAVRLSLRAGSISYGLPSQRAGRNATGEAYRVLRDRKRPREALSHPAFSRLLPCNPLISTAPPGSLSRRKVTAWSWR